MKTTRIITIIVLVLAAVFLAERYYQSYLNKEPASDNPRSAASSTDKLAGIKYRNEQYGFSLALPASWQGYSVINEQWTGTIVGDRGEEVYATGTQLAIRHPLWTAAAPRQDIPVMIFTLSQWQELGEDKFHIGAAPIGPSELGHNSHYVFALPARYNYAFPAGFEEVDRIIASGSFKAF